ncbi:MAG: radical SAM protein [Bacteroidales bacterium]|jgi:wyosine [tRNA(Phe)-imidazoG37] synthetase (radical SAM superfamily)
MATFLFDDIIFGPVTSRRLGASLGINLLPTGRKFCNFNCLYCECGLSVGTDQKNQLPGREEIRSRLEEKLLELVESKAPIDRITFAGNGEPTIHPDFSGIIEDTIEIRNRIFPMVKIAVLSNATQLEKPEIFRALGKIEMNILKLDSAIEETVQLINRPPTGYSLDRVIEGMMRFQGRFILQTLFLTGSTEGRAVDNTSEEEVTNWIEVVKKVRPEMVMIYTIARDTPIRTLQKAAPGVLDAIASKVRKLGIPVQVSY